MLLMLTTQSDASFFFGQAVLTGCGAMALLAVSDAMTVLGRGRFIAQHERDQ